MIVAFGFCFYKCKYQEKYYSYLKKQERVKKQQKQKLIRERAPRHDVNIDIHYANDHRSGQRRQENSRSNLDPSPATIGTHEELFRSQYCPLRSLSFKNGDNYISIAPKTGSPKLYLFQRARNTRNERLPMGSTINGLVDRLHELVLLQGQVGWEIDC